jgi:hypothetical protein
MARWRQPGVREMLQVFLLLSAVAFVLGLLWRPALLRGAWCPSCPRFSVSGVCRAAAGSRGWR